MTAAEFQTEWNSGAPTPLRQVFKDLHTAESAQSYLDHFSGLDTSSLDPEVQGIITFLAGELPGLITEYGT